MRAAAPSWKSARRSSRAADAQHRAASSCLHDARGPAPRAFCVLAPYQAAGGLTSAVRRAGRVIADDIIAWALDGPPGGPAADRARLLLLDSLGCALAGLAEQPSRIMLATYAEALRYAGNRAPRALEARVELAEDAALTVAGRRGATLSADGESITITGVPDRPTGVEEAVAKFRRVAGPSLGEAGVECGSTALLEDGPADRLFG